MAKIDLEKLKNLAIGISGIYSLYFVGSVIQQRIMKVPYENINTGEKELFQSSNAFLLIPSLVCWFMGYLYNTYIVGKSQINVPVKNWFMSSAIILAGTLTMTKAIYLTSYPLVTLFKSCNLLSVITVGIFFSRVVEKNQKLQKKKLIGGFLITIGILLFHLGKGESKQYSGNYLGIILLIISVIFDGLLPDFQAQIKSKYSPTAMQMFQHLNKWKSCLSLLYSLYNYEFLYLYEFFVNHPTSLLHMMGLILTNALGQIVIYWMITCFRQHVVPFVITTRKLFTVGISILYFKHDVTWVQIMGIIIVFIIVCYDFIDELTIKQIITNNSQNHIKIEQNDEGNQELKYAENLQNYNLNQTSQNLQN